MGAADQGRIARARFADDLREELDFRTEAQNIVSVATGGGSPRTPRVNTA